VSRSSTILTRLYQPPERRWLIGKRRRAVIAEWKAKSGVAPELVQLGRLSLKSTYRREMHLAVYLSQQGLEIANIFSALRAHHKPTFSDFLRRGGSARCAVRRPLSASAQIGSPT
jgi:hypothetical protein